ncbi:mitochondrial carrier protein CoAc1-like [Rutidosis leptorrhynchoides]|uniref:mitochondrial carrier protein CoAc1-like n=1 Tax=Rutidosis leptorrhynchoides TaxID=125765 RepID=UPI003A9A3349
MTFERFRYLMLDCHFSILGSAPLVDLLAGSAAGAVAILSTYPLDLARTLLAYQVVDTKAIIKSGSVSTIAQPRYTSTRNVLAGVYREAGVRGLYRGLGPTLMGILPYAGLRFCVYEELKRHVSEEQHKSIAMSLSCGAIAAIIGQTITNPLDVVKRQMQVENMQDGNTRHKNTWKGITTIVSKQGWRQLFAGLSVNYLKIVPSTAIGFTAYDLLKEWMHVPPRQKKQSVSAA